MKWLYTYIWPTRQKGTIPSRLEPHPLTMMGESHPGWIHICSQWWNISCTYIWPTRQKGTTIQGNTSYHTDGRLPSRSEHILLIVMEDFPTFIQTGTHPITMMKYFPTFIQTGTHLITVMKYFPTFIQTWTHPITVMKDFPIFIQTGTHPITVMKELALTSDPTRTHPSSHIRMAPSPRLSYLVTDQAPPFS